MHIPEQMGLQFVNQKVPDMEKTKTIEYYDKQSRAYTQDTFPADVTDLQKRFLKYLRPGALILDFGCGSGRDSKAFLEAGYRVEACDGSEEMCRIARKNTGLEVRHMLFQDLNAEDQYDGIWACASVLHLPKTELAAVFQHISAALKKQGYAYVSFKYGMFEGERNGRYFTDLTETALQEMLGGVPGLSVTETWISSDVRKDRADEKWLNAVLKKSERTGIRQ